MALPATDAFTDDNGTPLPDHNANWTEVVGSFVINTNQVYCDGMSATPNFCAGAGWNGDAFNDDQYSEATVSTMDADLPMIGLIVRCDVDTPAATYYMWDSNPGASFIEKVVAGARTTLNPGPGEQLTPWAEGDRIRFEIEGADMRFYINDVLTDTWNDATIASGAPGIGSLLTGAAHMLDNWEGGNLFAPFPRSFAVMIG